MSKIFVTGGAGFIGSWVTKILLDEGHEVTVFDNLVHGHKESLDTRAHFVEGDLADVEATKVALQGHDAVIHMAALIEVGESVKFPIEFTENNVLNSVKLLEAMRQTGVKSIVFSSSATVYGEPRHLPIPEEDPIGVPANPYGATKVAMEYFCQTYHVLHNFDVTILRYFNPYGPGELHEPETHAIPNFVKAALAGKPIPVYWQGEQVRDFIYIEDLARAHTAVLKAKGLTVYNIGTEHGTKVKAVLDLLAEIFGRELAIADLGERPGDIMANYASSAKLQKETGWKAAVDLKEGLARTVDYFRNTHNY